MSELQTASVHRPTHRVHARAVVNEELTEAHQGRASRRTDWPSPEILAWLVGASDFFLVLVAGASALAAHYSVVEQAGPGRHMMTAFLAATLFVSGFERIGGYRLT